MALMLVSQTTQGKYVCVINVERMGSEFCEAK